MLRFTNQPADQTAPEHTNCRSVALANDIGVDHLDSGRPPRCRVLNKSVTRRELASSPPLANGEDDSCRATEEAGDFVGAVSSHGLRDVGVRVHCDSNR